MIGSDEFIITQFPATKGLKYQKHLAKLLLPAFAEISKSGSETPIILALEKLAENIDLIQEDILKEMVVTGATKGTSTINFDIEFAGNYGNLFNLLKEIVVFNYESVFTLFGSDEQ